jgi:hypothetical protein
VAAALGLSFSEPTGTQSKAIFLRICPSCNQPTFFRHPDEFPGVAFGSPVKSLPKDVASLYEQVRKCSSAGAYTPAVLSCRKILMHIAVDQKAKPGMNFLDYVEHLANNGFVPPNGRGWVDHIRKKGNEANHEIVLMAQNDAEELIIFVEMLLKFIYEFPNRIAPSPTPTTTTP